MGLVQPYSVHSRDVHSREGDTNTKIGGPHHTPCHHARLWLAAEPLTGSRSSIIVLLARPDLIVAIRRAGIRLQSNDLSCHSALLARPSLDCLISCVGVNRRVTICPVSSKPTAILYSNNNNGQTGTPLARSRRGR